MGEIDLLVWEGRPPQWTAGAVVALPRDLNAAQRAIDDHVQQTSAEWLLFWNPSLGDPDPAVVDRLVAGRADAWHSGLLLGQAAQPEEHDYIHPIWPLALDGDPDHDGVSWRASLDALLVRTGVLRVVGGLDPAFRYRQGAGLELGRRMIERGAVVFHTPDLVGGRDRSDGGLGEHDRFAFLQRTFGRKWVRYAAIRRMFRHPSPAVIRGYRSAARACAATARPGAPATVVTRPVAKVPDNPRVSVVLPTLGRYELVRIVLEQLRVQTLTPLEVIVVDQNDPELRDPELYAEFADLGLVVIYQEQRGQWLARNAAVQAATGEWIAFVDDDSEIGPEFLAHHLEGLARYDADLSTGASLAVIGAPVPENYAFFRVADQWDSGNGMCHRSLLERVGLFDQQFDRQRRGDAEFGLRVQVGGGLVVHNPDAIRIHLKAQQGGLRTFGSLDGFRHRDRSSPLPLPSMVYYTKRYHSPRQVREDLVIGLTQAVVPYDLKRRARPRQWAAFLAAELTHVPSTVRRVRLSLRLADEMVAAGPDIPRLPDPSD